MYAYDGAYLLLEPMNITALARKLKLPTKELLEMLPEMGFDIGRKAIKINDSDAQKIVKNWRFLLAKYKMQKEKESETKDKKEAEGAAPEKKKIAISDYITVKDFAIKSGIPITTALTQLMKSGVLSSMNERIDFETAQIIGEDLGIIVERSSEAATEYKDETISEEEKSQQIPRPPVIVIMGHVDHGKTKLLDTIRKTNVMEKESGRITQHMGAYQVERNGKTMTFIDTPGHEAFTTMRSRGAKVADIAILIIAADDGIMPQTKESIRIIKSGRLPMIVAINKIDKPQSDIEKVKQQLAQENLLPEDWGGNIVCIPISALTGQGVDELLENILLLAEMEKQNIVANPEGAPFATIIESHIDAGEGPVATALIQQGTLKPRNLVFFNNMYYGKIRALKNFLGKTVAQATPSMPIKLIGLKGLPAVGDILLVREKADKRNKAKRYQLEMHASSVYAPMTKKEKKSKAQELNLILRADVLGSLEAIIGSLEKISHPDVHMNIIGKGLGHITEKDVMLAESSNAHILSFHSTPSPSAQSLANEKNIPLHNFSIIYQLIDKIKELMLAELKPEVTKTELGRVKILKIFRKDNDGMVVGGIVIAGMAVSGARVNVFREEIGVGKGRLSGLQLNKIVVKDVPANRECGMKYVGSGAIEEGDVFEVYDEKVTKRSLEEK